jgi:DNA-binding transcriptional ArsR family regulator
MTGDSGKEHTGDELVAILSAVANPQRIRVLAELGRERAHVSELARRLGISRPLLYLHLRKLEAAGLIAGSLELSADGKAMKFYAVVPFELRLTPQTFQRAAATLTSDTEPKD